MAFVPSPPIPSKEQFLANPNYYWNEIKKDQLNQMKINRFHFGVIAFGIVGIIIFVGLMIFK